MEDPDTKKRRSTPRNVDDVISLAMPYVTDPKDRDSASLVNRTWLRADSETREHVTMALCYASSPERLSRRFPNLTSLKLKGKPRAAMFNLIPENWGGFVSPWVNEIALSMRRIRSVHFRRMIVSDLDLDVLARARLDELEVLKLDKCLGFSTDGLLSIVKHCRKIKTFLMEDSSILEKDGKWLHELALHNTSLEVLNLYMTELTKLSPRDLETIAKNCHRSLVSVKVVGDIDLLELVGFFNAAVNLEEFRGGSLDEDPETPDKYTNLTFPPKLTRVGISYLIANEMPILFPFAAQILKLDLLYAFLETVDHCILLPKCPNLEVLETRNVIGDKGLEALGKHCKKLKRLRIERDANEDEINEDRRGGDEDGNEDLGFLVTQRGLTALAKGCKELEYIAVYAADVTNACLRTIGVHLKSLVDFRLVLIDQEEWIVADLPLDEGVRSLLMGCEKLRRFALYLRPGGLTDVGLGYVGRYSPNVRWMLLGYLGETDEGLMEFSRGCPKLQKLEMRGCCFSERAIAAAVMELTSLRYLWVQGYGATATGEDLRVMSRPCWNIELIQARRVPEVNEMGVVSEVEHPGHILAYYSLAGHRTDYPPTVRVLKEL
ncbi:Coronatine-insensitive protein 1 [Raphanus sativus]|uniref:Coronatine-insensitive protein 1-like n=1 Tax=Raphanus sativus TaxID=3726 RepID=A0A9W3DH30_RAPSA|nr:coronatine-insensitive protein 1-like [Raphanus sativus]KAJ4903935.1 Coronatine-insensitive protein 1 [Raphanus sativus]